MLMDLSGTTLPAGPLERVYIDRKSMLVVETASPVCARDMLAPLMFVFTVYRILWVLITNMTA